MGNIGLTFLGILLFATSIFMMLLILVQRGKGGGLTGALGGMGGQSAFGAKAGDVFTRITVVTAIIWITLCMITIAAFNPPPSNAGLRKDNEVEVPSMSAGEEDADESDEAGDDADTSSDEGGLSLDEQAKDFISDNDDSANDDSADGESTDGETTDSTAGDESSSDGETESTDDDSATDESTDSGGN